MGTINNNYIKCRNFCHTFKPEQVIKCLCDNWDLKPETTFQVSEIAVDPDNKDKLIMNQKTITLKEYVDDLVKNLDLIGHDYYNCNKSTCSITLNKHFINKRGEKCCISFTNGYFHYVNTVNGEFLDFDKHSMDNLNLPNLTLDSISIIEMGKKYNYNYKLNSKCTVKTFSYVMNVINAL
jgi:hypothetical protein